MSNLITHSVNTMYTQSIKTIYIFFKWEPILHHQHLYHPHLQMQLKLNFKHVLINTMRSKRKHMLKMLHMNNKLRN